MIVREIRGSLFISQWYPHHRPQAGPEFTRGKSRDLFLTGPAPPTAFPLLFVSHPKERGKLHEEQLYLTEIHASVRAYVFHLVAVQS